MNENDLQQIIDNVNEVYSGDDPYAEVADIPNTDCDINAVLQNVKNIEVVTSVDGTVLGYDYKITTPQTPTETEQDITDIDSNNQRPPFGYAQGGGGSTRGGGAGRGRH